MWCWAVLTFQVKAARPKSMKKVYAKDPDEPITTATSFHRNDEAETEVDVEDTVKGEAGIRVLANTNTELPWQPR